MSQQITETPSRETSNIPVLSGIAFGLPYLGIWILLIYINLAVLPKYEGHPSNPMFNILLNAAQLLPLAVAAFIYGRRLSHWLTISRSSFFKQTALMTIYFAAYEGVLLILMFALGHLFSPNEFRKFPAALYFVAPLFTAFGCSIVFACLHTISGLVVFLIHPRHTVEAPPA